MKKIDLKELGRWLLVNPGTGVVFDRPGARTVRIEANPISETSLSIVDEQGEVFSLATIRELSLLEFSKAGRFELFTDAPCYVYSAEFEVISFVEADPVIFTKIAERRQVSPEMQMMMKLMHQNNEKLYAKLDVERERTASYVRALEAERARATPDQPDTAVPGPDDGTGHAADDTPEDEG